MVPPSVFGASADAPAGPAAEAALHALEPRRAVLLELLKRGGLHRFVRAALAETTLALLLQRLLLALLLLALLLCSPLRLAGALLRLLCAAERLAVLPAAVRAG